MFPYLNIFGQSVPSYGILTMLGVGAAGIYLLLVNRHGRCGKLPTEDIVYIALLACVGVIVGGKILYVAVSLPQLVEMLPDVWQNLPFVLVFLFGGMVFYGGLLGAMISTFWYCRRFQVSLHTVMGICAPAIPLFHTFGRMGCFAVGCCWGLEWSVGNVFHHSPVAPNGVILFPTQLAESIFNVCLFFLLSVLAHRWGQENAWKTFPLYLLLYSLFRFAIEFFRGDTVRGIWFFSTSQWISLAIVLVLIFWFIKQRSWVRKARK